jgi:[protein-PII] uridylyltransferase
LHFVEERAIIFRVFGVLYALERRRTESAFFPPMTPKIESIKQQVAANLSVALGRHRAGESARRVVEGLSDSMDALLRPLFVEMMNADVSQVALIAVGGYGRRELCPHSDIDLMFLRDSAKGGEEIERMVRLLWDAGFRLGHSVRTPEECLRYMFEDDITAAALLEGRTLAGGESLVRRFGETLNRYGKRHGEAFVGAKLEQLRRSIEAPDRTIFVTEPHVKEGAGCLRDIQQIVWIERLRRGAKEIDDIAARGDFAFEDVRQLAASYEFYLRLRCELHFTNGLRQDILERESQLSVARGLGYAGEPPLVAVERLMSDYFRHATGVLRFARYYLETGSRGGRFFSRLRHRLFSSRVNGFLSLLDGRLYLAAEPGETGEKLAEDIVGIFSVAQDRGAEVSESLAGWIRRKIGERPLDFSRSPAIRRTFARILAKGAGAGRVLARLHEAGVLGRILPEFGKLTCLVTFDGHHQFTVDEHTLRALRELDRIEEDPGHPEAEFREALERIPDRLPLRLALLLHDIGKSGEGKHGPRGTEAAVRICERLGIDARTIETVESLIYLHLVMFQYSERTDLSDDRAVESFGKLVETEERLDMLYLLTYLDVVSVGPGTWTAWKGAQLADLYARTKILLRTGALPRTGKLEEELAAAGFDPGKRAAVLEHCRLMASPAYERDTIPERMAYHVELIEAHRRSGRVEVGFEEGLGYSEVTFCARDRSHLFADLAGLLLSEGLDVLGARIFSRSDGIAIDLFQVEIADRVRVGMERRIENLRGKLKKIERGKARASDMLSDRSLRYRLPPSRPALLPPRVSFDNEISAGCTVIVVEAGDRTGLLYDLARAMGGLGLDVRAAKVSTLVDRAHDTFYVVGEGGGKVADPGVQAGIVDALLASASTSSRIGAGRESGPPKAPPVEVTKMLPENSGLKSIPPPLDRAASKEVGR